MPYGKDRIMKLIGYSPKEWAIISERSKKLGMRTGTYIRTISVQGSIKVFNLKELSDVYKAMNRIGVNINQIARSVNAGIATRQDVKEALFLLRQVYLLMERVADL